MKRIIITGGPSSGKTSLIKALKSKDFYVIEEKARVVIQREVERDPNTNAVPWKDVLLFSRSVADEIVKDRDDNSADIIFFDRGIPDVMGYLNLGKVGYDPKEFELKMDVMRYSNQVFFLPPWEEIYENDSERKESYEESVLISQKIKEVYLNYEFLMIEVPKKSISERIDFILSEMQIH